MTKSIKTVGLSILALAALAGAQTTGVTIHRTVKEGDVVKYRMNATLSDQSATAAGLLVQKVAKVDTDGSFTLEESQAELKVTFGGQDIDMSGSGSGTPTSYVVGPDGVAKKIIGSGASPDFYRMLVITGFVEPGKAVNVGDTWTKEFKTDANTGQVAAKAEYKYLGEEKVGAVDCYKVHGTITETEGSQPASNDATYWIDKSNGQMVKTDAKWVNVPFPGAGFPINAQLTLTREG